MVQPINYMSQIPQPDLGQSLLSGLQLGTSIREIQEKRVASEQAEQIKAAYKTDLQEVLNNPSMKAFNDFSLKYPQQREVIKDVASRFTTEQQDAEFNIGRDVAVALENDKPEIALGLLTQTVDARKKSNLPPSVYGQVQQILSNVDDPDRVKKAKAQTNFALTLLNPEKFGKVVDSLEKQQLAPSVLSKAVANAAEAVSVAEIKAAEAKDTPARIQAEKELREAQAKEAKIKASFEERQQLAALDKINWDVKNLKSQINDRVAKLNLDRQTTQATVAEKLSAIQQRLTDIPESARKLVNESATLAATSKQAATQYNDLATRIESAGGGKGKLTSATEWFAANLGQQDAWTQIRNEYTRVRNSVAIKALPPGVATDKDIELALKGIPPETANAATLASFLRGTAKLQDIDSSINNAKTDWLSQNNGLLTRAKAPFIAGDYAAKAGETFNDFAQRIVGDVSSKYRSPAQIAEDKRQQLISQIPTNQTPVAAPTQTSIEVQADAILRGGR